MVFFRGASGMGENRQTFEFHQTWDLVLCSRTARPSSLHSSSGWGGEPGPSGRMRFVGI